MSLFIYGMEMPKQNDTLVVREINGKVYIKREGHYVLLDSDGNFATSCITNSFEKTGKHVDIDKILEAMKE